MLNSNLVFCVVIFSGTNWSVHILSLEDVLLQMFLSSGEDFRGYSFMMVMDLYNRDVL